MKYNVLKITASMSAMVMVMIVTLLIVACPEPKAGTDDTNPSPNTPVLKTLVAPGAVTAPEAKPDTSDKSKITVTTTVPATLGTTDGTPVDAKTIKYELYYARYGHTKDTITIDGGTSIADIAQAVGTSADENAGIVPITGNAALTTTGFVIPALSEDRIYRYFIRSIHPDDETKHTNTAARWAFVLNPASTTVRVIPNSVTSIGKDAFKGKALTQVFIPDSVTSIGVWAFLDNKLMSVFIPNSVTSIGASAFENNLLMSVTIGNAVTSIGVWAFLDNKLTSVVIPDSVTSIGIWAFVNNNLMSVTLSSVLHKKIKAEGVLNSIFEASRLSNIFGAGVTTYQDHAGTQLNL